MRRGETVRRIRRTPAGTDRYGDPLPAVVDELDIPGCGLAPHSAADRSSPEAGESTGYGRDGVVGGYTLYAPPEADIARTDRVEVRGVMHEVTEVPAAWRSPYTGRRPGLVVTLRHAEG